METQTYKKLLEYCLGREGLLPYNVVEINLRNRRNQL